VATLYTLNKKNTVYKKSLILINPGWADGGAGT